MSLKDKLILFIDDDLESCVLVKRIIENAGCHFQSAQSIEDALTFIHQKTPSLILLDLHLGKESGLNFLEIRGKDQLLRKIPVVVFSAITRKDVQEKSFFLGANDFLEKPIKASSILQKIRKNLKLYSLKQYFFPDDVHEQVKLQVPAELKKLNELFAVVRSPLKLNEGTNIELDSELLKKIGMLDSQKGTVLSPSLFTEAGTYDSKAQLLGLNDNVLARIKKIKTLL